MLEHERESLGRLESEPAALVGGECRHCDRVEPSAQVDADAPERQPAPHGLLEQVVESPEFVLGDPLHWSVRRAGVPVPAKLDQTRLVASEQRAGGDAIAS